MLFRSIKHDVHTIEVNKLALSAYDHKRIVGEDGISTKAITHYNIYPTGINITNSERNQEATLCLQELTSALLIQMLSQAQLLGSSTISLNW